MVWLFQQLLALVGCLGLLFSLFVAFHVIRPQRAPADKSNRLNKIRLLWYALTRENLFTKEFPWLKNDELQNVKDVK